MHIEIINGPNLNLLEKREPEIYGAISLESVEHLCRTHASANGMTIQFRQTNCESTMIDWIHGSLDTSDGIIINPAAYSFTSIAILDALKIYKKPIVEVHLANIHQREPFRHRSYVSLAAQAVICGMGKWGYVAALDFIGRRDG